MPVELRTQPPPSRTGFHRRACSFTAMFHIVVRPDGETNPARLTTSPLSPIPLDLTPAGLRCTIAPAARKCHPARLWEGPSHPCKEAIVSTELPPGENTPAPASVQSQATGAARTVGSAFNTIARDRKNATPKTWAIGCGSLMLLCLICWGCSAVLTATGIVKPPTATPIATVTTTPTITPTEEPEPTATEKPAEDPQAKSVREYMGWAAPLIAQLGKTMNDMTKTLGQAGDSPAIVLTDGWRKDMGLQLAVLSAAAQVIRTKPQSEVPEPAAKLHGQMLELADKLDSISTNLASGIDNMDASKISAANEAMASVNPLTAKMGVEIDALGQKYGAH